MTSRVRKQNDVPARGPSAALDPSTAHARARDVERSAGVETGRNAVQAVPELAGGLSPHGGDLAAVQGAKVMIVDDASMTVRLLKTFLEDAGYTRFVTTHRSTEAMSLILAE